MSDVTLAVPDMSCGHCKAAVEGELNRLPGVERSNADVERGIVAVRYVFGALHQFKVPSSGHPAVETNVGPRPEEVPGPLPYT
jgi:copper chaperone CopZ